MEHSQYQWFSARLWHLQCLTNGDTTAQATGHFIFQYNWTLSINSLASGGYGNNFNNIIFKLIIQLCSLGHSAIHCLSRECHRNSIRSQHWFKEWLGAVNQQAITGDKVDPDLQYIPRNMHTVFALLCFVVVIHWLIFPYPSGLLHWHCGNLTIAPVPAKQPWWIWINTSCEFIMNDCITTTKQSTTKPCAYFLGYTVCHHVSRPQWVHWDCGSLIEKHKLPHFQQGFNKLCLFQPYERHLLRPLLRWSFERGVTTSVAL